jgi:hypothetical protein
MSLRHSFTWKKSADVLAQASRVQAELWEDTPGIDSSERAEEYRKWEAIFRGCAGAEYKLDKEDLAYFGLIYVTPGEIRAWFKP